MKKFWSPTELQELKGLIDLSVSAKTNAYHIHKILQEDLNYKLTFDQIYHGVLKAIKDSKKKEIKKVEIQTPKHLGLIDIYSKIQHNPARWYGVKELWGYIRTNNTLAYANTREGQIQVLGNIISSGGFSRKRNGFGIYYFIDSDKFRDYLVSLGILKLTSSEIKELDTKEEQKEITETPKPKKKRETIISLYEIEEVPIGKIKDKFLSMKFKRPQDFINSLLGRTQKVYYSGHFCIYFDSAKSHFYEFCDETDKNYILDSIKNINVIKDEPTDNN